MPALHRFKDALFKHNIRTVKEKIIYHGKSIFSVKNALIDVTAARFLHLLISISYAETN